MKYRVYEIVENSEGELVKISWGEKIENELSVVSSIARIMERQQVPDNPWIKRLVSFHVEVVE